MQVNSIDEIIKREKFIIKTLERETDYCPNCNLDAIIYHQDIISYMEELKEAKISGKI